MWEYKQWELGDHVLEFYDVTHTYLLDGVQIPSITQILKIRFGNKYDRVDSETLKRAAERGTAVHEAIEKYCKEGLESDLIEVKNFKFLKKLYDFTVIDNEIPVVLMRDRTPIAAGRLDMVIRLGEQLGGADIKRTATLDKEYITYQLNLYRVAYMQTYGIEWEFLRAIHLKENIRKFVNIPINESIVYQLIEEYLDRKKYIPINERIKKTEGNT